MSPRSTRRAAYRDIADALRQRIASGDFATGSLLPSEAALCSEFRVARNTARRALAELERAHLITTLPGTGRFVCDPEADPCDEATRAVPQYRRIATALRAQIDSGEIPPGAALPSEATLVARYGTSRGTVRQALSDLEGADIIESVHGKGRFVRRR